MKLRQGKSEAPVIRCFLIRKNRKEQKVERFFQCLIFADLFGGWREPYRLAESDEQALAGDWEKIGEDMRRVLEGRGAQNADTD